MLLPCYKNPFIRGNLTSTQVKNMATKIYSILVDQYEENTMKQAAQN